VMGMTLLAEKGLGKSHLISRIRRKIKTEGGAFFVYMSETDYADINNINSMFLATLTSSLKKVDNTGMSQWHLLASLLINDACGQKYSLQQIVDGFPKALSKNANLIDELSNRICQTKSAIQDPYILRAILWTLSKDFYLYAVNWLAGKELGESHAKRMNLPITREEDRESRSLAIATQILDLMGEYQTIVTCFDELEAMSTNSQGLTTSQVVAALAKDLYSKLKRGILIMAMYPQTWKKQIETMPQSESVMDRIGEKKLELEYLKPDAVVDLVSTWLNDFYKLHGVTPPHMVYPFNEEELQSLGKERPIVRRVLQWCQENWPSEKPDLLHNVKLAFDEQIEVVKKSIDSDFDDSKKIAKALILASRSLIGKQIDSISIEAIEELNAKRDYLDFCIVGKDKNRLMKIGVSVMQESGSRYITAGLKRLIDYKKFDLTRGCLVRSKEVKKNTQGWQHLNTLLQTLGGEWVPLKQPDICDLLAISAVFDACELYEITEKQVFEFIDINKIAIDNYLVREILSDPSGEIPDALDDEDLKLQPLEAIDSNSTSTNLDEDLLCLE
jgi:hypothetical protein